YHADRLMKAPVGHFFDVMSNGFGAMPSYASRVPVQDRWRIAAYIRALQLSENAKITDVPEEQRTKLMAASEKEDIPEPNPPYTGTSYLPPPPEPAAMEGLRGAELPNPYSGEIPPATTQKSAAPATGGSK
ncbi:MAG: c-type cytochrome, partial [Bryobacteraceae bacterium]